MRITIDISRHDAPLRLSEAVAAQRLREGGATAV